MSVIEKVRGRVKRVVGQAKGDPIEEAEGRAQESKAEAEADASRARVEAAIADAEAAYHGARQKGAEKARRFNRR